MDNELNGKGRFRWANGDEYYGDWKDGCMTGKGKMSYATGELYDGDWLNNQRIG